MEVCMKPKYISLLVSLDQRAVPSHIGKCFTEVCLAHNSKICFPLRKSKDKCTWKCLRLASNHIGRTVATCFVLFLIAVASDLEQDFHVKPRSPFMYFCNMLFRNYFSAQNHIGKPYFPIV